MKKYLGAAVLALSTFTLSAQDDPNVLAIMVDDVAQVSLSAYSHGMTYNTPNIDRIANDIIWIVRVDAHHAQKGILDCQQGLVISYRIIIGIQRGERHTVDHGSDRISGIHIGDLQGAGVCETAIGLIDRGLVLTRRSSNHRRIIGAGNGDGDDEGINIGGIL